jgi:hypothetical protein
MLKVRIHPPQIEILFWDLIFWLMKILQRIRDQWISFVGYIRPKIRLHLLWLICVSALGLGLGFILGFIRANLIGW